jgi:DNA-binding CsgD family transcriptional regulator
MGYPALRKRRSATDGFNSSSAELEIERLREMCSLAVEESMALRLRTQLGREAAPARGLSRREREVLKLIVEGKTSKEVAAVLGISFKTAVTHRTSIMDKLEVHQTAALVREAIRLRLV